MAGNRCTIPALFFMCFLAMGRSDSNVSCYRIEPATVAGIICADVLLTLIIVITTYQCARVRCRKEDNNANKVYMNVRNKCKN